MAKARIEGGTFFWEKSANNAKAQTIFTGAALMLGFDGDPQSLQEVLDFVGAKTVDWWVRLNENYRREQRDQTITVRTEFEA